MSRLGGQKTMASLSKRNLRKLLRREGRILKEAKREAVCMRFLEVSPEPQDKQRSHSEVDCAHRTEKPSAQLLAFRPASGSI